MELETFNFVRNLEFTEESLQQEKEQLKELKRKTEKEILKLDFLKDMLEQVKNKENEEEFDEIWDIWYDDIVNIFEYGEAIDEIRRKFYDLVQ